MIIAAALIVLFAIFFLVRKHIGPTMLAVIAGLSVFDMFGKDIAKGLTDLSSSIDLKFATIGVYLVLVVALPILLYFRSSHGGLFGVLRIFEGLALSALLTSLSASQLKGLVPFDQLSFDILNFIESIKGLILVGGIAVAYFDILFYRNES